MGMKNRTETEFPRTMMGMVVTEIQLGNGIICWNVDARGRCTMNDEQKADSSRNRRLRKLFMLVNKFWPSAKDGDHQSWYYKQILEMVKGSAYSITVAMPDGPSPVRRQKKARKIGTL